MIRIILEKASNLTFLNNVNLWNSVPRSAIFTENP